MSPTAFLATASGLMMDRVRSTAMQVLQWGAGNLREIHLTFYFIKPLPECRHPWRPPPRPAAPGRQHAVSLHQVVASQPAYSLPRSLFPPLWRGSAKRSHALFFRHVLAPRPRIRSPPACYSEV